MRTMSSEGLSSEEREEFEEALLRLKVASRIEVLAEDTGVSRAELARRLGRSKPWISKVLSGYHNLTLDTLSRIGWALGVRWEVKPHVLSDRDSSPAAGDGALPQWVSSSTRNVYADPNLPAYRGVPLVPDRLALYTGSYPDTFYAGSYPDTVGVIPTVASMQSKSTAFVEVAFVMVGVFETPIPIDVSSVRNLLLESRYVTALPSASNSRASQYLSLLSEPSNMEGLLMEVSWGW
jgi:antitoxin component HigA of HigAB toxin-antitoxin module